jgi:hypothetical protein
MVNSTSDSPRRNKAKLGQDGASAGTVLLEGANRAKRTQLPEAGHRGGVGQADIPLTLPTFQYSTIPALQRGTKGGGAKQTQFRAAQKEGQVPCRQKVAANGARETPWKNKANLAVVGSQ